MRTLLRFLLYFVCLILVIIVYNFILAPYIANPFLNDLLVGLFGGIVSYTIYKLCK